MLELLQLTLDGVVDGAAYALVGLGLTLTFGSLRRLNLAYGATAMLAAYVGAWLHIRYAVPTWAVALVIVVLCVGIGGYVEQLAFANTRGRLGSAGSRNEPGALAGRSSTALVAGADGREVVALAASFALWMQLEQIAVNLLPRHLNDFPSLAATANWFLPLGAGELMLRPDRLALAGFSAAVVLGFHTWMQRSRQGLAWRAAADFPMAAHLVGMPVARVQAAGFAVACALSGVAAFAVLSLDAQVTPMFGMWMLLKGLTAAMLGGLGSLRGVLVGGVVLGLVESYAQALLGAQGREFATYAVLFLVLVWPGRNPFDGAAR
jgi:branched-subunit amino acid ABC-type transport system permease component